MTSGYVAYRVRFAGRPELSVDQFEGQEPYRVGDILEGFREGLDEPTQAWAVTTVVPGADGRPDTLVCDVVLRPHVDVSDAAARFAQNRGGRVYIWVEHVSSATVSLRASTADPGRQVEFDRQLVRAVEVLVAKDVPALELKLRLSVFRNKLVAEWVGGVPGASGVFAA